MDYIYVCLRSVFYTCTAILSFIFSAFLASRFLRNEKFFLIAVPITAISRALLSLIALNCVRRFWLENVTELSLESCPASPSWRDLKCAENLSLIRPKNTESIGLSSERVSSFVRLHRTRAMNHTKAQAATASDIETTNGVTALS